MSEQSQQCQIRRRDYRRRTVSQTNSPSSIRKRRESRISPPIFVPFVIPRSLPLNWVLSTTITVLIDHLLYARGLIPLSIGQLNDEQKGNDETSKSASIRRKVSQCQSRLTSLKTIWNNATENSFFVECKYVLLSIGPSFSRSKEFFLIDATKMNAIDQTTTAGKLPSPHALARRLLPKVMECNLPLPSRSACSYQLWVSVYISSETLEKVWNSNARTTMQTWVRRPGFQLSKLIQKPNQRVVNIQLTRDSQNTINPQLPNNLNGGHWLSLPTSIKGFRLVV